MKKTRCYHKILSPLGNQRGITLMVVLVMLVIMGLSMGIAGSSWKSTVQRSKEQELLFRGGQYRKAIEAYTKVKHGGSSGQLPSKLEDLLKDPRFPQKKRHIRQLFKDPMTGEDFVIIKDPRFGGRIKGVHSSSDETPFKTDGFIEENEKFAGAQSYKDWRFVYEPPVSKARRKVPPGKTPEGQVSPGQPQGQSPDQPGIVNPETDQPPASGEEGGQTN